MSDKIKMWLGVLFFVAMCGLSIYGSFKYPHLYLIPGDYGVFVPNSIAVDQKNISELGTSETQYCPSKTTYFRVILDKYWCVA